MNRLALELTADAKPLLKTLDAAQRNIDRFVSASDAAGKSLGGGVNQALEAFEGLAKGGAGAVGVLAGGLAALTVGMLSTVASAGRHAEMLDQVSQKTGIAMSAIQSATVLMAESGLTTDGLTAATKKLSQHIVDSHNPAAKSAALFQELGVTAQTTEGVLGQVADLFTRMPDGAGKTALAVELLGRAGQDLIPVLNKGSEGLRQSAARSRELGAILSDEAVKALGMADDAFDQLGVASAAVGHQLGALLAPSVTSVVRAMATGVGTVASFFGALQGGAQNVETALPVMEKVSALLQKMGAPGFDTASIQKSVDAQNAFAAAAKLAHEEFIAAEQASGQAQEDLGEQIVRTTQLQLSSARVASQAFADRLALQERVNALQFEKPSASGTTVFDAQVKAAQALIALMPQLTFHEANLLAIHNSNAGQKVLDDSRQRLALLDETAAQLAVAADTEQAYANHAAAAYQQVGSVFGDVTTARLYALEAIDARLTASTAALDAQFAQQEISTETYYQRILQLDLQADAKRRGVAAQFPTFYEQQLQALVNSNTFSLGQISSNFTNATAQWIVTGKGFEQFWQQLQVTLVQTALNSIVQMAANFLLHQSVMQSAHEALEATKTAATAAGEGARLAIIKASSVAISASMLTTLAAIVGIGTMALGVAQIVVTAISSVLFAAASAAAILPGGQALAGALIASATLLGVVGTGVILAGQAAIQTAAGAAIVAFTSAIPAMAEGGVALGPSLVGEAGPEAVIPLNARGAAFMQDVFGTGGGGDRQTIQNRIYLNGRAIADVMTEAMPGSMRTMGVL